MNINMNLITSSSH